MKRSLWIAPLALSLLGLYFLPLYGAKWLIIKKAEKKTASHITIDTCRLSWLGPQSFEKVRFNGLELDGTIGRLETKVPLWRLSEIKDEFSLTQGHFTLRSASFKETQIEQVEASLHQGLFSISGQTQEGNLPGSFSIQGTAKKIPTDFSVEGALSSFPTALIDRLLGAEGLLIETLGSSFDVKGTAQSEKGVGTTDLVLSSPQCQTQIQARFDRRFIYLRKPLFADLKLTPSISAALMREINPLFITGIRAKNPIRIEIDAEGFAFPYHPFEISHLIIGRASLDMGRIRVANGPTLQSLIALLQANPLKHLREMDAWFTPLTFAIENGVVHTQRLDLLLDNSIHICTWGDVDLVQDKLRMYLGLPADTLAYAFGLKGLNPDYVKKIPIRGTTGQPDLQSGPAAAEIATLVAAQKLPIPGKAGRIIGNIANAITQLKNDPDVPPAKRPFPWER